MWICKNCGEDVEDDFDVCWNCQFDKNGSPPALVEPEKKDETEETKYPFHWGAFLLAPLWLLFHGRASVGAFLFLVKVLSTSIGSFFAILGYAIVLVIAFSYGSQGYKIAWETGKYLSFEQMKRSQLPWVIAGIGLGLTDIIFTIYRVAASR